MQGDDSAIWRACMVFSTAPSLPSTACLRWPPSGFSRASLPFLSAFSLFLFLRVFCTVQVIIVRRLKYLSHYERADTTLQSTPHTSIAMRSNSISSYPQPASSLTIGASLSMVKEFVGDMSNPHDMFQPLKVEVINFLKNWETYPVCLN